MALRITENHIQFISHLESREVITEMSILEHTGFACPECGESLRGRQAQKVGAETDNWELRIRCSCGVVVVAIND